MPPTEPMTPERQTLEKLKALKASFDSQPNVSMWDHEGWLRKKKAYESSLIHTADALFAELERAWASEAALGELCRHAVPDLSFPDGYTATASEWVCAALAQLKVIRTSEAALRDELARVREERRRVRLGVIEFHSESLNPGLTQRFFDVVGDLRASGSIVDLWLLDIAKVLAEFGYSMEIYSTAEPGRSEVQADAARERG